MICAPITSDGQIDPRWGRAERVALATLTDGQITGWQEIDVHWGQLRDEGTSGAHHARIVRFLREHDVDTVVAGHVGPGMQQVMSKMGVRLHLGATGAARTAVETAARQ